MRKSALMGCMSHRAAKEITQLRAHVPPSQSQPTTTTQADPHLLLPVLPAQHPPQHLTISEIQATDK